MIILHEVRKEVSPSFSVIRIGLSWYYHTLKTKKRRFQTILRHRSLALSTVVMWLPTRRAVEFVNMIGRNVVVASKSEGWCTLSPIAGTGS